MIFAPRGGRLNAGGSADADAEGRTCNICDDPLTGPPLRFEHRQPDGNSAVPPCTTVDACASCWRDNMRANGYAKCLGLGCTLTISRPSLRALEFVGEERDVLLREGDHVPEAMVDFYECPQPRCTKSVYARPHPTKITFFQRCLPVMGKIVRVQIFLISMGFILLINIFASSKNEQGKHVPNEYVAIITSAIMGVLGIVLIVTPIIPAIPRSAMQLICSVGHTYPVPTHWTDSECFIAFITRACPRCHARIERNGGCPIMKCRCGHSFQWEAEED